MTEGGILAFVHTDTNLPEKLAPMEPSGSGNPDLVVGDRADYLRSAGAARTLEVWSAYWSNRTHDQIQVAHVEPIDARRKLAHDGACSSPAAPAVATN